MIFIAGISSKIKDLGTLQGAGCPACGQAAAMHVCKKYMTPTIFFIPTFHFSVEYLATCTRCASVMSLERSKGRAVERDPYEPICSEDLSVLQNNNAPRCPQCGSRTAPSNRYCPDCGAAL